MARLRTWAEFKARGFTPAEHKLVQAYKTGVPCVLGEDRPTSSSPERNIRADFLRYLILGGCEMCRPNELGINLEGGWIEGSLDISRCKSEIPIALVNCYFLGAIVTYRSNLDLFSLEGSFVPGLIAQEAQVAGSLFLKNAMLEGWINLWGAKIGGRFDGQKMQLRNPANGGFSAESMFVGAGVDLDHADLEGGLNFLKADIRGDLTCNCIRINHDQKIALNGKDMRLNGDLYAQHCVIDGEVNLSGAEVGGQLRCEYAELRGGSHFSIFAQQAEVGGFVFLRHSMAEHSIDFSGARIGSQFACENASFKNRDGPALNLQGIHVTNDLILSGTHSSGLVNLTGAKIGGQLNCLGAKFSKPFQRFNALAFTMQGARVGGGFVWKNVEVEGGGINVGVAHVSDLSDDLLSWPTGERFNIDGMTYDRISGAFTDVPSRLEWLRRACRQKKVFFPRPYSQLAKVYREMGHDSAAREILIEREELVREYERRDARFDPAPAFADGSRFKPVIGCKVICSDCRFLGSLFWDRALCWVAGYGYAPGRSFVALAILFLTATALAEVGWREGSFAPNSGVVLVSEDWKDIAATQSNPAAAWSAEGAPGMDWDSFNAFAYGLDLVVPILDLGQTEAWAPSKDRGDWGKALWWGRWLLSTAGWIVTALGAAAITGIIQPKRE